MSAEPNSYVPAWKRLGLQLKCAAPILENARPAAKKRRLDASNTLAPASVLEQPSPQASDRLPQSHDKAKSISAVPSRPNKSSALEEKGPDVVSRLSSPAPTNQQQVKRKKSVQFAPEAKQEDGDGVIDEATDDIETPESMSKLSKKEKRNLRKQITSSSFPTAHLSKSNDARPSYLTYLELHAFHRNAWKFNKAHQTHLLKNIFHLYRIPPSYDQAISSYVAGLKGEAAKQRLRSTAQSILSEPQRTPPLESEIETEAKEMENPSFREEARIAATKRDSQKVREAQKDASIRADEIRDRWQKKLERRARAEQILLAIPQLLPEDIAISTDMEDRNDKLQKYPAKRSRGRKRRVRTGVPDDDDSSSSSSSDDDSSDDSMESDSSSESDASEVEGSELSDSSSASQSSSSAESSESDSETVASTSATSASRTQADSEGDESD